MKIHYLIFLLVTVSCSLNANQEANLSDAVNSYISTRNEGAVVSFVASTHPDVVAFYRSKGDSFFLEKFDLSKQQGLLKDGNIKEIRSKNRRIQVLYEFVREDDELNQIDLKIEKVVAFSEDDGKSWYFADFSDYANGNIFKARDRLIKNE